MQAKITLGLWDERIGHDLRSGANKTKRFLFEPIWTGKVLPFFTYASFRSVRNRLHGLETHHGSCPTSISTRTIGNYLFPALGTAPFYFIVSPSYNKLLLLFGVSWTESNSLDFLLIVFQWTITQIKSQGRFVTCFGSNVRDTLSSPKPIESTPCSTSLTDYTINSVYFRRWYLTQCSQSVESQRMFRRRISPQSSGPKNKFTKILA